MMYFFLSEGERGKTDLIQMDIETGDARPIRQHPRRMPYSAREEVARQLKKMQEMSVIQPSKSPWSSPVVLARKKNGSQRFCVDYHKLNSVIKADTFPLPRIDNLLANQNISLPLISLLVFGRLRCTQLHKRKPPSLPLRDCLSLELCRSA